MEHFIGRWIPKVNDGKGVQKYFNLFIANYGASSLIIEFNNDGIDGIAT